MPAFNDFKYTDNATLLEYEANPAMGWADVLGGTSPLQPWPRDNSGLVNIHYCWPDLETKSKLENAIQGGWEMWHGRLGNGGPGSCHSLGGFSEYKHSGSMVFCWLDDEREEWNPNVPSGTLVITIDPHIQFGGYATIGYNPEEWDSRPHRHQMRLSWADWHMKVPGLQHWLTAHEIGHVLALTHEHQRGDRFHYVHFDCKNLVGYAEAEKLVPSHPTMTMDKLCNSPIYSQLEPWKSLGLAPHDYSTQEYYDL
ncbi:hypothetical protein E8E11_008815 [Didymella keratinophila]|nr:hypothetical protein E8E11_008815 [Didymella keratinophila]